MSSTQATVLALVTGKGGVGKTSLATGQAGLMALAGARVCVVDTDPQGNVAQDLGFEGDEGESLMQSLVSGDPQTAQILHDVRPNLDVIAGGHHLNDLVRYLYYVEAAEISQQLGAPTSQDPWQAGAEFLAAQPTITSATHTVMGPLMERLRGDYDYVIVDTPPRFDLPQAAVLAACDYVLASSRSDVSSILGLAGLAQAFVASRTVNPDLKLLGVVLFGVTKGATRVHADAQAALREALGDVAPVMVHPIRYAESAAVAGRQRGKLMHEIEALAQTTPWWQALRSGKQAQQLPRSAASLAEDYALLTQEILTHLHDQEEQS